MDIVRDAAPIAPTFDAITWDEAVNMGAKFWEDEEQSKWALGDMGAIVASKWKRGSIKKFANSIGMHDRPGRLRDYVKVARFWSKDVREQYPNTTWSVFRELSRHKLTPERALELLTEHHDKPVAKVREAITGRATPPKPTRETWPAELYVEGADEDATHDICLSASDWQKLLKIHAQHPDAKLTVTVEWTPANRDGDG